MGTLSEYLSRLVFALVPGFLQVGILGILALLLAALVQLVAGLLRHAGLQGIPDRARLHALAWIPCLAFVSAPVAWIHWRASNGPVGATLFLLLAILVREPGIDDQALRARLRPWVQGLRVLAVVAFVVLLSGDLSWRRKRLHLAVHAQWILDDLARFEEEHGRPYLPGSDGPDRIAAWRRWGEAHPRVQTSYLPERSSLAVRNTFATGDYWAYSARDGWNWPDADRPTLERAIAEIDALRQTPDLVMPIPDAGPGS